MMAKISDIEVSGSGKLKIKKLSMEEYYLKDSSYVLVDGTPSLNLGSTYLNGSSNISIEDAGDITDPIAPDLADIESVTKSIYYDPATKEAKAKLVIKIRNSSPDPIIGIDTRIAKAASEGGVA